MYNELKKESQHITNFDKVISLKMFSAAKACGGRQHPLFQLSHCQYQVSND